MKDREQLNITCTKVTRQMLLAVQAEITQLAPRSKGRRIMPLNDVLVTLMEWWNDTETQIESGPIVSGTG